MENSFGDKVFFCNSGAEANEAAIKLARRYSWKHYGEGRSRIIAMENSFHGRTIATLSATGQPKFHEGFGPLVEDFTFVPFNDLEASRENTSERTCAVILECIQSEGGVFVADKEYLKKLRELTRERDILLILDEVQTGIGRTGKLFGYEHYAIEPDMMSLAKALGNGFPVGAIVAKDRVMDAFEPGTHASTFGGNPLAASAVIATLNTIMEDGVVKNCEKHVGLPASRSPRAQEKTPLPPRRTGHGPLLGLEFDREVNPIVQEYPRGGRHSLCIEGKRRPPAPSLIIEKEEIDIFLEIASHIFERLK